MVDISGRMAFKTIVDNNGILWLNGKHLEGLDHKK